MQANDNSTAAVRELKRCSGPNLLSAIIIFVTFSATNLSELWGNEGFLHHLLQRAVWPSHRVEITFLLLQNCA